ncbi:MAG: hypothetical protein M3Y08_01345 [Fibrobacterota bacterium]|nr:hypothetical protein [Fibrobacterota bacterium]
MKESPEQIARFAAEMAQLAKDPRMKPYLTSTEAKRQEREAKREAEAEQKRKEEWLIEAKRRDDITAEWFNHQMKLLAPKVWAAFKAAEKTEILSKAGWDMVADMTTAEKPGHLPVPVTICTIKRWNKAKRIERLVWEEPKPIPGKIIKADA